MSLIETAPQKTKTFDGRKQDHGDAAQRQGHYKYSEWDKPYQAVHKRDQEHFRVEMNELNTDFSTMNSAELSAEADKLLGEEYYEDYETPGVLLDTGDLLETLADTPDEQVIRELRNEYIALSDERAALLESNKGESFDEWQVTSAAADALSKKIRLIEAKVSEIVNSQDRFATEADFGVKSKDEIRREMARRVTLDPDYDLDDTGDSDYKSGINIKNRL